MAITAAVVLAAFGWLGARAASAAAANTAAAGESAETPAGETTAAATGETGAGTAAAPGETGAAGNDPDPRAVLAEAMRARLLDRLDRAERWTEAVQRAVAGLESGDDPRAVFGRLRRAWREFGAEPEGFGADPGDDGFGGPGPGGFGRGGPARGGSARDRERAAERRRERDDDRLGDGRAHREPDRRERWRDRGPEDREQELTAAERAELLAFIAERLPELHERHLAARAEHPERAERFLQRLAPRLMRLRDQFARRPAEAERRAADMQRGLRVARALAAVREAMDHDDPAAADRHRETLRGLIAEHLDQRLAHRRAEVDRLRAELRQAESELAALTIGRDEAIEAKLDKLLTQRGWWHGGSDRHGGPADADGRGRAVVGQPGDDAGTPSN